MTTHGRVYVILGRAVCISTAAAACLLPSTATAQSRAGVSVSAGASAASNPYLLDAPDTDAIGVSLTVDPFVFFEEEAATVTLNGSFTVEKFSRNYPTDESASLGASGVYRLDERTTFKANAGFRTSESGARRYFRGLDLENIEPGEFPDGSLVDPTLGNFRGRTTTIDVDASVERLVGPNSVLTVNTGLGLTRVELGSGVDYRNASFAISYSRQITPRTTLRTSTDAGYVDYIGRASGDGMFATALVGAEHQLSQSLNLSAQVGASVAHITSLVGGRRTTLSWAGQFDLCNTYPRGTLCATASRSAQPTAWGGLTNVTSVGLSYSHSLGTRATATANAQYGRTSRGQGQGIALSNGKSELASVTATYRHQLGERLSAYVTPSFTSIYDDVLDRRSNYQIMLGVTYAFGRKS